MSLLLPSVHEHHVNVLYVARLTIASTAVYVDEQGYSNLHLLARLLLRRSYFTYLPDGTIHPTALPVVALC